MLQSQPPCECKAAWNYRGTCYKGCDPNTAAAGETSPWCYINEPYDTRQQGSNSCSAIKSKTTNQQYKNCTIPDGKVCVNDSGTGYNTYCESNNCKSRCCKVTVSNCSKCNSMGDCETCNTGFVKKNDGGGGCRKIESDCAFGTKNSPSTREGQDCATCNQGYYLDNKVCKPCTEGTYQPMSSSTANVCFPAYPNDETLPLLKNIVKTLQKAVDVSNMY